VRSKGGSSYRLRSICRLPTQNLNQVYITFKFNILYLLIRPEYYGRKIQQNQVPPQTQLLDFQCVRDVTPVPGRAARFVLASFQGVDRLPKGECESDDRVGP